MDHADAPGCSSCVGRFLGTTAPCAAVCGSPSVVPTVLDAAAALGSAKGARLMDRALQRRMVTLEQLRRAQVRRSGRRGAPVTARPLALAAGGAVSEAERLAHTTMRLAGIVGWVANVPIDLPGFGRAVVDVAFAAQKVILEIDGWAHHRDLRAFLVDGPRQSALTADGWVVVRTHWYELTESGGGVRRDASSSGGIAGTPIRR